MKKTTNVCSKKLKNLKKGENENAQKTTTSIHPKTILSRLPYPTTEKTNRLREEKAEEAPETTETVRVR